MKPIQILRSYQRANKAVRKRQTQFVLTLIAFVAVMAVVSMIVDPVNAMAGTKIFYGASSLALLVPMMSIGDVDDLADKYTTGDNIYHEVYLIDIDEQIDKSQPFPVPNASREVGTLPMLPGQYMKRFSAHTFPTYVGTGEKGDITITGKSTFVIVMAGVRDQLASFAEDHLGKKFIILYREVGSTTYKIEGDLDRPILFQSYEAKNDKDGRYMTFTFERSRVVLPFTYSGSLVTQAPVAHTAGDASLAVVAGQDNYSIPNGVAATYAITGITGITASDKGRVITLTGSGTTYPATIGDNAVFVLEEGSTWTAKSGSRIQFRVFDSTTLVEVAGSRVQTA